jgi:hypothetical protein
LAGGLVGAGIWTTMRDSVFCCRFSHVSNLAADLVTVYRAATGQWLGRARVATSLALRFLVVCLHKSEV